MLSVLIYLIINRKAHFENITKESLINKLFDGVDNYNLSNKDVLLSKLNNLNVNERKYIFKLAKKKYSESQYNIYLKKIETQYSTIFLLTDKIEKPMALQYLSFIK